MKTHKHTTSLICAALLALGSISLADTAVPNSDLTPALGAVKDAGNGKYDFKRANHDLPLEDIVMNASPNGAGSVIKGSFTLTHLYKAGPFKKRPADHILVSFTAKEGKTETNVTPAPGQNPWGFIIQAGATAAGAPPAASAGASQAVTGLSSRLSGNAGPFMAQGIASLADQLASLSAKKY